MNRARAITSSGRSARRSNASRRVLWLVLAVCAALLSGCVEVPTTGPVEPIEGEAPPCQKCVTVEVEPPAPGDEPKQVVQGYLRATSIYQPNYAVAKQYLTRAAAETWSPEDGAQIYSGSPASSGKDAVGLSGELLGSLGRDRTYTARNEKLSINFGMVREDGEWRISRPPRGLMIPEYDFPRFYTSYNLYFIGNDSTLVPDPIYLPNLSNQSNIASVLIKALLGGPSEWLKPAVSSVIPPTTALSVDSVTIQNGVAEVSFNDAVVPLNDRQRSLLAAQVVYTLKQLSSVTSVLIKVDSTPFHVPESDDTTLEVGVDDISADVQPVPFVSSEQLYAVRGRSVQVIEANAGAPNPQPMPGVLGRAGFDIDNLAVSVANTDIAVVTNGRTVLRSALIATGDLKTRLNGVTNLLRPQYSRYGELWAVGDSGGKQKMWMFSDGGQVEVQAQIPAGGRITSFRLSPDGSRMALVRTVGGRSELGLARISRKQVTVDGWRPLDTSNPDSDAITQISDVGWLNATELLVLGRTAANATVLPYRVSEDASQVTPPIEPNNLSDKLGAFELTIRAGTPETSVIIGRNRQSFKDDGSQWLSFVDGYNTMAFPG
ncbi:MAG: LpqB family beta-propeller domain-containing protein [Propionibacteriaceae bacterium]